MKREIMSETCGTCTHPQDGNYFFDKDKNIWFTKNGNAVTTLHLSSLRYKVTRAEISSAFSCFGEIEDVRILKKPKRSYGFVYFRQAESVTRALSTKFHTIGGHKTRVAIAQRKLSESNAKTLLSLNDDCLYEIFSLLDIMDLCALASTCDRLKAIAGRVFSKIRKVSIRRWDDWRLMLVTFGSLMSELRIGNQFRNKKNVRLLELSTTCCSDTLETLKLESVDIPAWLMVKLKPLLKKIKTLHITDCTFRGADKEFFANCESLVELEIDGNSDEEMIFENTFPKLERYSDTALNSEMFIKRHTNLKSLRIYCSADIWPTIGVDCKQLEHLHIECGCAGVKYIKCFKRLSTVERLRILNIELNRQSPQSVTTVMKELKSFKSLKCLELQGAEVDSGFISALSQLKQLQVLRLNNCNGFMNLHLLLGLEHLTELTVHSHDNVEVELVSLIKRFINLQNLHFKSKNFKLDTQLYQQIVDVVRARPFKYQQFLEMTCIMTDDFQCDANNFKILKLKKITQ